MPFQKNSSYRHVPARVVQLWYNNRSTEPHWNIRSKWFLDCTSGCTVLCIAVGSLFHAHHIRSKDCFVWTRATENSNYLRRNIIRTVNNVTLVWNRNGLITSIITHILNIMCGKAFLKKKAWVRLPKEFKLSSSLNTI